MFILDRYILRLFLKVLMISFVSLTGLFIVIDLFAHVEDFISNGEKQGGILAVLADYYGARVLMFFDRTAGLLALVAAMFSITWLQRSNELTAIQAAGVRKVRVAAPLILAALVVSILGLANREWGIPAVKHKLTRGIQDWAGENARPLTSRFDHQTNIFFSGRNTVAKERRIDHPVFRLPDTITRFGNPMTARAAYYREPTADRPGGYLLEGVEKPTNLSQLASATLDGRPVILSPLDTPWLEPQQCFVVSEINFEQLTATVQAQQFSSTRDLIHGLHNPALAYGADTRVLIHSRFVQPFLDMTLLFLGLPLVLTHESRSVFVAAGRAVAVVAIFFLVVLACHGLGANYLLEPVRAAWGPLVLLAPIAVWLSRPLFE